MSTRQIGNRYENEFCELAEAIGYCTYPARGSRGPIDVLCFPEEGGIESHLLVPLAVQVGTHNKPIHKTLNDLLSARRPIGSICLVARRRLTKSRRVVWTFHAPYGTYDSLQMVLDCREAA